ncbi:hypothetical protein QAD02_019672 [Eretmocerus hayati]|uniref:Uncharacterized protein n=1 Tax=Eretmocerus hayati TaxID=131215 RepID=A0ACC2PQ25_9HYME|nr:hypothetical protein QAD02_019672 [Eretmocerus hayati]
MEKHGLVARGRITDLGARGNKYTMRKWDSFANILNKLGPCQKNGKGWKLYWKQCRLQSRRNKARFTKAYRKTGHETPAYKLTKEDERICNIFGNPGLGFAIIPECGFPARKPRPTNCKYQMETICYFVIEEPGFGIALVGKRHWKKPLKILEKTMGPKFDQSQWRDFWFKDMGKMLEFAEQIGVEHLDNHSALLHQAYTASRDYAELMSAKGIFEQLARREKVAHKSKRETPLMRGGAVKEPKEKMSARMIKGLPEVESENNRKSNIAGENLTARNTTLQQDTQETEMIKGFHGLEKEQSKMNDRAMRLHKTPTQETTAAPQYNNTLDVTSSKPLLQKFLSELSTARINWQSITRNMENEDGREEEDDERDLRSNIWEKIGKMKAKLE